ncbi:hypothetical protein B0H10DRAFT_2248121 [Mycena sp. CBHHK59/15]|nr:hypothetical protein B0H10DRAFT_2248121 [Mycena sp. CBHHK59/15]
MQVDIMPSLQVLIDNGLFSALRPSPCDLILTFGGKQVARRRMGFMVSDMEHDELSGMLLDLLQSHPATRAERSACAITTPTKIPPPPSYTSRAPPRPPKITEITGDLPLGDGKLCASSAPHAPSARPWRDRFTRRALLLARRAPRSIGGPRGTCGVDAPSARST